MQDFFLFFFFACSSCDLQISIVTTASNYWYELCMCKCVCVCVYVFECDICTDMPLFTDLLFPGAQLRAQNQLHSSGVSRANTGNNLGHQLTRKQPQVMTDTEGHESSSIQCGTLKPFC